MKQRQYLDLLDKILRDPQVVALKAPVRQGDCHAVNIDGAEMDPFGNACDDSTNDSSRGTVFERFSVPTIHSFVWNIVCLLIFGTKQREFMDPLKNVCSSFVMMFFDLLDEILTRRLGMELSA